MLVILIVASLLGIEAVRRQRQASLVAEHRYRLFQMRDCVDHIDQIEEADKEGRYDDEPEDDDDEQAV